VAGANFGYDNADRLTTITHSSSSAGALATYLYSYDSASQLQQYTGPEGTLRYTYDLSGELKNVGDARLETYSYDLNGNRNYGSYSTGSDNGLTADGSYTFGYDAEGNMTSKTRVSDGENWTYAWDDRNRLTQVVEKTSGGVTVTNDLFTYDVENRRIGKSVNGTQSWFGYDGQNSYADFNGSGSLTVRYLTGQALDSLYARFDGTNTGWYLDDTLGSVRQVVNTSGTVLDALTYDSYGQILSESNSSNGDRFTYTSREWDSEIGQYYYRARNYNASKGRFISQDPEGFGAHDLDLYRYVANRPQQFQDPSGREGYGFQQKVIEGLKDLLGDWTGSPTSEMGPSVIYADAQVAIHVHEVGLPPGHRVYLTGTAGLTDCPGGWVGPDGIIDLTASTPKLDPGTYTVIVEDATAGVTYGNYTLTVHPLQKYLLMKYKLQLPKLRW
jgi:RHS repeat-associated protein